MVTYLFMNIFSFYLQYLYTPCDTVFDQDEIKNAKEELKTNEKEMKQGKAIKNDEENLENFVISDEISIDLDGDYDVLMEFGAESILDDPGKSSVSYAGENLGKLKSHLHENDEIKASKIKSQILSKSNSKIS